MQLKQHNMQPIRNEILWKPMPPKEITDGGLVVPDSCKQVRNVGIVVAIGSNVKHLKVGNIAHRVKNWGTQIIIDGELHFLMTEQSILALE